MQIEADTVHLTNRQVAKLQLRTPRHTPPPNTGLRPSTTPSSSPSPSPSPTPCCSPSPSTSPLSSGGSIGASEGREDIENEQAPCHDEHPLWLWVQSGSGGLGESRRGMK
ncbi:unnamed protein product [Closterium sp. NIES-54]